MAWGADAGLNSQASSVSFPEATTTVTPSFIRLWTAEFSEEEFGALTLIFATAGSEPWSFIIQLIPEIMEET
jgi:hypothetical protein